MKKYRRIILALLVLHVLCLEGSILLLLANIAGRLERIDFHQFEGNALPGNTWSFLADNALIGVFVCGTVVLGVLLACFLLEKDKDAARQ